MYIADEEMKSYKDFIYVTATEKVEIINITVGVEQIAKESSIKEGFVLVFPHHTSSAVYISDSDPSLVEDYLKLLDNSVPSHRDYLHNLADHKRNADAHLKAILTGHHIVLPLSDGRLDLGTYQTIYYAEFDGQREKEILVKIIGE